MAEKSSRKSARGTTPAAEKRENWKTIATVLTALTGLIAVFWANVNKAAPLSPEQTSTPAITITPEDSCDKYFNFPRVHEIFSGFDTGVLDLSTDFTSVLALKFVHTNGDPVGGMKLQFRPATDQIEIFSIADQYCMAISSPGQSMLVANGSANMMDFNQVPYVFTLTFSPSSSALEVDLHQK